MRLLLDTHAFVWFVGGNTRLSSAARSAIEDLVNVRLLSAASMWEIAIKVSLGKLSLNVPFGDSYSGFGRRSSHVSCCVDKLGKMECL